MVRIISSVTSFAAPRSVGICRQSLGIGFSHLLLKTTKTKMTRRSPKTFRSHRPQPAQTDDRDRYYFDFRVFKASSYAHSSMAQAICSGPSFFVTNCFHRSTRSLIMRFEPLFTSYRRALQESKGHRKLLKLLDDVIHVIVCRGSTCPGITSTR